MNLGVPSKHRSPSGDILAVGRRPRTRVDASAPRGALVVLGLLLATLLPASALAPAASAVTLSTSLSGATAPVAVSGAPSGPPAPSGGWKVAYADGFGASLGNGAGQDNTWKLDQRDQGCCNNGNEINAERPEMVSVGSEGLNLRCERREVVSKPYVCGGISGYSGTDPTGYRTPKIEFKGQTMALEFTAKLPPAHGRPRHVDEWLALDRRRVRQPRGVGLRQQLQSRVGRLLDGLHLVLAAAP